MEPRKKSTGKRPARGKTATKKRTAVKQTATKRAGTKKSGAGRVRSAALKLMKSVSAKNKKAALKAIAASL